ncbi:hypothetical protein QCA50_010134 [Cerrena zonata]|uniref:Uncharacterized protein n=1 Tax=Cerrena zonata TaxID=2478898 RepID=A0AAW0G4B9_9APHY
MQLKALIAAGLVPAAIVCGLPVEKRSDPFQDLLDFFSGDLGSIVNKINQGALNAQASQQVSSILQSAPNGVGAAVVTGSNGLPQVELTSLNGPVITLANGPGGVTTTFAGQTYTIVTATAPATTSSGASSTFSTSASTTSSPFASSTSASTSTGSSSSGSSTSSSASASSTTSSSSTSGSASSTSSDSSSTHSADPKSFVAENKKDNGAMTFVVPLISVVAGIVTGGWLVL